MVIGDIPEFLRPNVMFNRQIQIGRLQHDTFEVVLTSGPVFHLTKKKQVLAVCDLSNSIIKGLTCQTEFDGGRLSQNVFDFDVYFTYASGQKDVYFFLKMMDKLIVMSKRNDTVLLHKEYENVRTFSIHEIGSTVSVKIEKTNYSQLCVDLYRVKADYPMVAKEQFSGVYATIANRVAKAKAELETTKLDVQKYFHELAKELRFGSRSLHNTLEERVMLAKYGDIWIRRHNDMLLFGVPVYNCCYLRSEKFVTPAEGEGYNPTSQNNNWERDTHSFLHAPAPIIKRLIENIRVVLLSDQLNQYDYDYKLHQFRLDEKVVANYDKYLTIENTLFPSFNQEWQPSENNNLHPETAAIIVIKTALPNFVDFKSLELDCFVHYDIHDSGETHGLQNFVGRISVDSAIFHDKKFLVTFNKDNVYKDLLAATTTSECIFIKIKFNEIAIKESFYDNFLFNLEFRKINDKIDDAHDMSVDKFDFLSTSHVEQQHSTNIYFLSEANSYWNGTIIRTCSSGLVDELKMYNRYKERILSLIQSIKSRFDKDIVIEFSDKKCNEIKFSQLKHAFQNEVKFIKNNLSDFVDSTNENFVEEKMQREFETDLEYLSFSSM